MVGSVAKGLDAITSVKSHPDLFIRVNESLKLAIELDVLAGKDAAMMLEGVDFGAAVSVLGGQ